MLLLLSLPEVCVKINESKVVVFSSHARTGGPELLHQLVYQLELNGKNSYICYYPFDKRHIIHNEYLKYKTPVCDFKDDGDTFFIIPESATFITKMITRSRYSIWWLSVDNYFRVKGDSLLRDFIYTYLSLLRSRVPIKNLENALHFTQSEYAKKFLKLSGMDSSMLTDYLGLEHTLKERFIDLKNKKDIIVYNPKKGVKTTRELVKYFKKFNFIPIQDMSSIEVASLLESAKIYIDFGSHPGKDRLPREAALSGCCIITNTKGSAENSVDICISKKYKLDEKSDLFYDKFDLIIEGIFTNFVIHSKDFDKYRLRIASEEKTFQAQVKKIFL